jgi:L-ribulose-5-phosphate 4-epimerase
MHDEAVEGVIKFESAHRTRPLERRTFAAAACKLIAWREILRCVQLVGRDPDRYGGAGYGNVSCRVGAPSAGLGARAFLITGTQTGGRARLTLDDLCVVERYDAARNRVESTGVARPSSEAMTHGAVYDLSPSIRWVLHAHSPVLWRRARALRLPTTDPAVPYGTVEMAREVSRLYRATHLEAVRILAMGGHEDGILAYGRTAEEAGTTLMAALARAHEARCLDEGGLCER